ncbi:hypothetical protein TA3x_002581 [Tundrisphaera sp. TA3]|uniref:hypothetical protein n=1 Tax=Tundrisphaera sp. TA3 TaxID=3435775 RepID=UPI003EB9318D
MSPDPSTPEPAPRRMFIREPGWRVGHKLGSEREFCYAMAPGQDYYHRLLDGEIYVHHGDERLCLACAERRGLLAYEPKGLGRPGSAASGFVIEYDPANDEGGQGGLELEP